MAYKLHTYLKDDDKVSKEIIASLGKSSSGLIVRDFIVPSDMPLWALHYALEKAYGFLNGHLHAFHLLKEDFINLNDNRAGEWRKNIGRLFKSPTRREDEDYWMDDYNSGSFSNWRKKKYTGPYIYKGFYIYIEAWQKDFDMYLTRFGPSFVVGQTGKEYSFEVVRPLKGYTHDLFNEHIYEFDDMPLEKVGYLFEYDYQDLVETLTIKELYQVAKSFIYEYDFGDGWEIVIEISEEVDKEDEVYVNETYKPLMIYYDGLNLIEDVGGIGGFCDFLFTIYNLKEVRTSIEASYEFDDKYYAPIKRFDNYDYSPDLSPESFLAWAKSLEWKEKLPTLDKWF